MLVRLYKYLKEHNELFLTPELTFVGAYVLDFFNEVSKVHKQNLLFAIYEYYHNNIVNSLIAIISFMLIVIYVLSYLSYRIDMKSKRYSAQFIDLMNSYTDNVFQNTKGNGNISWGKNKVVVLCPHLIEGWKSEDIVIDNYDDIMLEMNQFDGLYDRYIEFYNSKQFQQVIFRGNNLARVMVKEFDTNYNRNQPRLFLKLKRSEWSQCSFIWKRFKVHEELLKEATDQLINKKGKLYPNSFTLHLVVISSDNKIVLSRISNQKFNDYPDSIAATLGEQLEQIDFIEENSISEDFVNRWVKRACREEFGIVDNQLEICFNLNSIRVLSLNYEGDIYNLSLLTTIKLNVSYNNFVEMIQHTFQAKEASAFYGLDISDIPQFIFNEKYNNEFFKHPSTDLRLLLVYLHTYGIRKGCKKIVKTYISNKK